MKKQNHQKTMKLVVDSEDLDRIIRASMHALNIAPPRVRKYPDSFVDDTLDLIKEKSLSLTQYKEFEKLQKQWVKMRNIWKQNIKSDSKSTTLQPKIERCARMLASLRDGEIVERLGTCEVIIKQQNQYIVGSKKFENCWKAAKFLCQ